MSKIMVIDDDPEISSLVQYTLESMGHTIRVCDNGREVIDAVKEFQPELMVMDVMLPGIDGYSLTSKITEDPQLASIPIIVLSALEPSKIYV